MLQNKTISFMDKSHNIMIPMNGVKLNTKRVYSHKK